MTPSAAGAKDSPSADTTQCGSSSTPRPTTSPTSCAPWRCRRRSSIGRSRRCARSWSKVGLGVTTSLSRRARSRSALRLRAVERSRMFGLGRSYITLQRCFPPPILGTHRSRPRGHRVGQSRPRSETAACRLPSRRSPSVAACAASSAGTARTTGAWQSRYRKRKTSRR